MIAMPPHFRKKPMRRSVVRRTKPSSRRSQGQKSLGGGQSGIALNQDGGGGVTNTAPHDMTFTNAMGLADGATGYLFGDYAPDGSTPVLNFAAIDDEGDPLVIEMTDNGGGAVKLINLDNDPLTDPVIGPIALSDRIATMTTRTLVADEIINFTIRVTDPGGLYVEQEFTITVMGVAAGHSMSAAWTSDSNAEGSDGTYTHAGMQWLYDNHAALVTVSIDNTSNGVPTLTLRDTGDLSSLYYVNSTDNNDGTWTLVPDGGLGAYPIGTHNFTLRATFVDTSYVEQEFTITVTA